MNDIVPTIAGSAAATLASTAASAAGDTVLTWVTLGINAAILISNCALSIYRKWRDRDKDIKESDDDGENDKGNE